MTALCERELSEGVLCQEKASGTIKVRDSGTGTMARVKVCERHKSEFNRKAAEARVSVKK